VRRRVAKFVLFFFPSVLLLSSVASAHPNHWTSGTGGTHSVGSHAYNPAHVAIALRAPISGPITSGGRFHDVCTETTCYGARSSWYSDWSLDLGLGAGESADVYLNADVDGWGTNEVTYLPDHNRDIRVYAVTEAVGDFRSEYGGDPACKWQPFEIRVSYWDTSGNAVTARVGKVWLAHITPMYSANQILQGPDTAARPNPKGTGKIYPLRVKVGTVYPGAGTVRNSSGNVCSTGPHVHVEALNYHNWGNLIEWHSAEGPDGYVYTTPTLNHIHEGLSVSPAGLPTYNVYGSGYILSDSVTQNSTKLGWLGGDPTSFKMSDNPYTSDH